MRFAWDTLKTFGFSDYVIELSDWDEAHPENYAGKPMWAEFKDIRVKDLGAK